MNPYFEANGKKWHADLGLTASIDMFNGSNKFYFYPQINAHFNVYENVLIPYAGISGGLNKNSYRSLTNENPFVRPDVQLMNTHNKFNVFGGLRGNLSSATSYDAAVKWGIYDNMHFFLIDYDTDQTQVDNKFKVVYTDATLLTVSGSVKYQYKEKIHFIAKGNYYSYSQNALILKKAFHKPDFDLTLSGLYNLKSKIIIKADIFVIGSQWALTKDKETGDSITFKPLLLKGIVDCNLGAEYRYSKMLSFFVNFNNIANMRYMRWEKYPTQRFNMMLGLTFVPF